MLEKFPPYFTLWYNEITKKHFSFSELGGEKKMQICLSWSKDHRLASRDRQDHVCLQAQEAQKESRVKRVTGLPEVQPLALV